MDIVCDTGVIFNVSPKTVALLSAICINDKNSISMEFLEILNTLEKEKADLLSEIMSLKQELRNSQLSMEVARTNTDNGEVTNVDIIKRLSQLEKMVYDLKKDE